MKRVLIVTSSYAPAITADMHRARMLAWDLPQNGWNVEILSPSQALQREDAIDVNSRELFNINIKIHEVGLDPAPLFRWLKMTTVGWRVLRPLYQEGRKLLRKRHFDLIYFSTTQFNLFGLGLLWKWEFGVPYVLDFQDPWVRTHERYVTVRRGFKTRLSTWFSKPLEYWAVRGASGLVSVSPNYVEDLRKRHPNAVCLKHRYFRVIPFGARQEDLSRRFSQDRKSVEVAEPVEVAEIVYVGAGGAIMSHSFRRIARLISALRRDANGRFDRVRLRLYGTDGSWRPESPRFLQRIAAEEGIDDLVEERPARISYSESLQRATAAQGLLVLGVDDPAYMPSKLFSYALTGKPLLVCLHQESQANRFFSQVPKLGRLIHFGCDSTATDRLDAEIVAEFLEEVAEQRVFDRRDILEPFLSPAAAARHAELFDNCSAGPQ